MFTQYYTKTTAWRQSPIADARQQKGAPVYRNAPYAQSALILFRLVLLEILRGQGLRLHKLG